MPRPFTIGQLATQTGVPSTTVRFYERRGLLEPEARSRGNYRQYGEGAVERLRFIRAAQASGFTLSDIRALLDFKDGHTAPCAEVRALIDGRLAHVAEQIEHLEQVRVTLARWRKLCQKAEREGRCGVIDRLSRTPARAGERKGRKAVESA